MFRVLDGGFGTELIDVFGYNIDTDPLWSSSITKSNPDSIVKVHRNFIDAGADIIESNTYQASFTELMKEFKMSDQEADDFIVESIGLAQRAIEESGRNDVKVAGAIGPYAAVFHKCSEYSGDYVDSVAFEEIEKYFSRQVKSIIRCNVDILAFETVPALPEAKAIVSAVAKLSNEGHEIPFSWIVFSCKNEKYLNHGELFSDAISYLCTDENAVKLIGGVGVNCTDPDYVAGLLKSIETIPNIGSKKIVVYSNSGEVYANHCWTWDGKVRRSMVDFAEEWCSLKCAPNIIGGCCRVYSRDILKLKQMVLSQ